MNEATPTPNQPTGQELLAQLAAMLRQPTAPAPMAAPFAGPGPNFGPAVQPTGLLVAVNLPMPDGSEVSGYLQLPATALADPRGAIAALVAAGWPLRTYQPRNAWPRRSNWGGGGRNW
jgi:hypothetical protein